MNQVRNLLPPVQERQHCRQCQHKIEPTATERNAFSSEQRFTQYFKGRCLICERVFVRKTQGRPATFCRDRCRKEFSRNPRPYLGRFWNFRTGAPYPPSGLSGKSENYSTKSTPKTPAKSDRAFAWRIVAAGAPISANVYHCATVGAQERVRNQRALTPAIGASTHAPVARPKVPVPVTVPLLAAE